MLRARGLLLFVVFAVALTGCFRSDLSIEVNDDGSGVYTQVVAINPKAFTEIAEQFGGSEEDLGIPEDPCDEIVSSANEEQGELPDGATVEPYRDGDFCGATFTVEFDDVNELQDIFGQISAETENQGFGTLSSFTLERDGDGWFFEAAPASSADTGGPGADEMGMFEDFMRGASNVVRLKLPGRQVDHNADRIDDDGTMIWNIDVLGDSRTLTARTEPGDPITDETFTDAGEQVAGEIGGGSGSGSDDDGGSSVLWIVLGAVVVVAAIAGFVIWKRKSGGSSTPAPAMAGATGAAGGAPLGGSPSFGAAPPTESAAAPAGSTAPESAGESAGGSPGPQWDPQRNAYIQWDPNGNRWMQYDDATKEWKPIA